MNDFSLGDNSVIVGYSGFFVVILGVSFTLMISYIKYRIGPQWALSAFYLFPIIVTTWHVGIRAGIIISFTSAISWLMADLLKVNYFSNAIVPYVNETFRLIVFLIMAYIVFNLKTVLEKQRDLAGTDPLTSALNRRSFIELADWEINKARRYHSPISFVYLDVDNFKKINDSLGHHIGDKLLRSVAMSIKNNIRAIDVTVRFGGDEFGILLAETGAKSSVQVVGKIKKMLLDLVQYNGWPVTFSIGLVTFMRPPHSIDEMINAADAQMYLAKQNGKNHTRHRIIGGERETI